MIKLPKILPEPERPFNLSEDAKWLAGEGAGSWFVIEPTKYRLKYKITRYSPDGIFECEGLFGSERLLSFERPYQITYPAHCTLLTICQDSKIIYLKEVSAKLNSRSLK